jgi:hypothetical protein
MAEPQRSQVIAGMGSNESKHSSHSGTRVARVRKLSQMRQSAGNSVLRTASPTLDSSGPKRLLTAEGLSMAPSSVSTERMLVNLYYY